MLKRALTARKIAFSERNSVITTSIKGTQISIGKDTIESRGSRYDRDATATLTALGNELLVMAAEQSIYDSAEENGFAVQENYNEHGEKEYVLERETY